MGLEGKAHFVQAAPGKLPFDDQSMDVVFSKDALIHVHDKEAVFADIFRISETRGVLCRQ